MKRLVVLLISLWTAFLAHGQATAEGNWEGMLTVGNNAIRLVFHLKKDSTGFSGSMDSPDQGAKGIALTKVEVRNDSLLVEVASIGGKASGRFMNDSTFSGRWTQGMSFPLQLKKVVTPAVFVRPQTPQPPFAYLSEDVVYFNRDSSIQYGATITIPPGDGPFPALILITGSGQQNRDEELFGHKPFAVLADYLTRQGFVVLRVDDRGVGQSTGEVLSATSRDFANDVKLGLDYLKERKEVAMNKIGILGHSEGGMIAQIVAAERQDIAFVISLAGPGQKITDLMIDQNRAVLLSTGLPAEMVEEYLKLYRSLLPVIMNSPSEGVAKMASTVLVGEWMQTTSPETVRLTTGISDQKGVNRFVSNLVQAMRSPWFSYFLKYNPAPYINKMTAPTLVLNGEKDIQVLAKQNLEGWRSALSKSSVKQYNIVELPGLNHLFQHCKLCTVQEYGQLEETIAPEALHTIGNWLKATIR